MIKFKKATSIVNNRVIALWRDKTKGGGFVLRGQMWKGGPQLRICVNKGGEIWLVQVQQTVGEGKSVDLSADVDIDEEGDIIAIGVEGKITMHVERVIEVESDNPKAPAFEVYLAGDVPQVEIAQMVLDRRRVKLVREFKKGGTETPTGRTNYDYKNDDEKPAAVGAGTQGGEKPTQQEGETGDVNNSDDIPF